MATRSLSIRFYLSIIYLVSLSLSPPTRSSLCHYLDSSRISLNQQRQEGQEGKLHLCLAALGSTPHFLTSLQSCLRKATLASQSTYITQTYNTDAQQDSTLYIQIFKKLPMVF